MGTKPTPPRYDAGVPELAKHLGVGLNTIRRHVAAWEIPYVRLGRQYRFNVAEVVDHLKKQGAA